VLEAADDELRAVLEAAELAPSAPVEVGDIEWQRILHGLFDTGVAELLGIEIRGIGRQVGHGEVARVGRQEGCRPAGAVRIEPIPDDQEGVADLAPEVPQGLDDKLARDATPKMSGIQSPCGRDRDDAGDLAPLAQARQDRGQPAPCPGGARPGAEAMAGLVEKEDGAALAARLLF
jgi:hypothetical protein